MRALTHIYIYRDISICIYVDVYINIHMWGRRFLIEEFQCRKQGKCRREENIENTFVGTWALVGGAHMGRA